MYNYCPNQPQATPTSSCLLVLHLSHSSPCSEDPFGLGVRGEGPPPVVANLVLKDFDYSESERERESKRRMSMMATVYLTSCWLAGLVARSCPVGEPSGSH